VCVRQLRAVPISCYREAPSPWKVEGVPLFCLSEEAFGYRSGAATKKNPHSEVTGKAVQK
jgi:hypothetical protein